MDNELDNGWDKELVNEHNRFRMKHLVGDRTFDKEDGLFLDGIKSFGIMMIYVKSVS